MANASRDQNNVPTLLAVSSGDGTTPTLVYADPTTHRLLVSVGSGQSGLTWGASPNSVTITDANVTASSFISVMPTTIPAGRWKIVPASGSFTITSSDAEASSLTFSYRILQ